MVLLPASLGRDTVLSKWIVHSSMSFITYSDTVLLMQEGPGELEAQQKADLI